MSCVGAKSVVLLGGIMRWIYVIFGCIGCIKKATHGEFTLREVEVNQRLG